MKFQVSETATFEGGHFVEGDAFCGRGTHGHTWTVTATVDGTPNASGSAVDHGLLVKELQWILGEMDGREIVDMAPGIVPTPEGLAAYIAERLLLKFPKLASVTTGFWGLSATAFVERG